ncbi:MAG TPA: NAD-dependent epimerase/dehydratase family protein [Opitutaceae bacterium]|nr:NAD-dependent epimerase/dehydratase family protein [Opitutaceae bacterium]
MEPTKHKKFQGRRLVVFGAGYIGGELARQARNRGLAVTALTRNLAKAAALTALGIEAVTAELSRPDWHGALPAEVDFAVNCVSAGGGGLAGYQRSYLDGLNSIREWAERARIGTLVYTSSTSLYPKTSAGRIDERMPVSPADEAGKILLEAESLVPACRCTRWFILRLAGIYGPGRHRLLDELRAGASRLAGQGEHRLNLIHRDDAVAGIWAALEAPAEMANDIFNLADDDPPTRAELTSWLAARLGLPAPSFTGAETPERRRISSPDRRIDNTRAKTRLGWQPAFPDFRAGYENLLSQPPPL